MGTQAAGPTSGGGYGGADGVEGAPVRRHRAADDTGAAKETGAARPAGVPGSAGAGAAKETGAARPVGLPGSAGAGVAGAGAAGAAEVSEARRAELAGRLAAVRARIAAACAAAGRDPGGVALMAVTKTISAPDVAALLDLGLELLGENRVQEATRKVAEVAALRPAARPRWHVIGGLQRNKVRAAVRWAEQVESLDSAKLADALDAATRRAVDTGERESSLSVLIQYSVDGDPHRGGVPREGLERLAAHVEGCAALRLAGLMAVAPLGAEPESAFADIAAAAAALRAAHPQAGMLSAGMSADMEIAIRHGCGVVRVGTALVGDRTLTSR